MKNNHEITLKQYAAYCEEQPLYLGTAGSYGMEMLTVIREGVWAEYDILATFHPPVGAAVQVRVGADNQIDVPVEATAEKGMGEIVFEGYKEGVRQIAVDVLYKVAPSSGANGTEPAEPTPDMVQQIMSAANAAEKLAQSVRDDADAGKFNGAKGDKGDIGPTGPQGEQGPKGERGEKGDPGKDAVIDTTLSHAGEAADAAEVGKLKEDISNKITKFYASNQGETHITDSDNGKIMDMMLYGKSSQDGTPTLENPVEIKSVVNPTVKVANKDGLKVQSVTLNNITLNAIPVASGGNVTIDGQQYIADRVVEKDGVFGVERNIREIHTNTKTMNNTEEYPGWNKVKGVSDVVYYNVNPVGDSKRLTFISNFTRSSVFQNNRETNNILYYIKYIIGYSQSELIAKAIDVDMYIRLQDAIFEPLPGDIQAKLRTLVTNYPVTNISVTSDQLDGYTVFNYPISMANGWNYVKQQLNDNRDYIYDMDLQSAEAYVNSEYAVALTELEV